MALRMVMLGKTGNGKSATGNTILGRECFETSFSSQSMTEDCSMGVGTVDGQKVAVIDTPGLFDTRFGVNKTTQDLSQCISYSAPGPHVFLVVIRLGRFTEEEIKTVAMIQEIFGQAAHRHSMVLFTMGDELEMEGTDIKDFIHESPDLQELVGRCNGQYHVFNNKRKDQHQVRELIQKIRNIVQKNGGSPYTSEMFREAEKAKEEERQRILREREEQMQVRQQEEAEERGEAEREREQEEVEREKERLKREMEKTLKEDNERLKRRASQILRHNIVNNDACAIS